MRVKIYIKEYNKKIGGRQNGFFGERGIGGNEKL